MSNFLVTPILFHYDFLDKLSSEAAFILGLNLEDEKRREQFKLAIFLNFNRYLVDSLLFLPGIEAEKLLAKLTPAMQAADETETLNILRDKLDFFPELRGEFLEIIKTLKK